MDEQTIMYLGFSAISIFMLFIGGSNFGPFAILVDVIALATVAMILTLNYADFMLFPAVMSMLGIKVMLSKNDTVPKEQNRVVRYTNGLYYATGYLTANIYKYVFHEEAIVQSDDQIMIEAPGKWERIVMNIDFPFKFNVISNPKDIQKYREDLEGRRGFYEFQISKESQRENPSAMTLQELQRKMNVLQARIDRISSGELPLNSIMYIETTAVGVSDKAAADALTMQLSRLETMFSSMDMAVTRVAGREVHTLYKFNYMLYENQLMQKLFDLQS
ncbi:MAG: hypothetical protein M1321_00480 [Candidatus Marsarchaeota archaeon]|nr:hypothetical protein [Candidatus Marsarchaeota archaeon]MCL5427647.1 hypothetical protein [Candidatus Marsarchaeota archaeon]